MSTPLVSIVIPVHNRPQLLREALDSVAAQTFKNYETIVVDDGSDEPLGPTIANHGAQPRIFRQSRAGPGAARNRGIAESQGRLIAFLDSDDLWLPEKLQRYVEIFNSQPATAIVYGTMIPMDNGGQLVSGRTKNRHDGWITNELFKSCFVDTPTVVTLKEVLTRAGGFDASLPVCEDYDLWLRLSVDHPFGYIAEPLAKRRLHDNRLSKSHMTRNLTVKAGMLQRFYEAQHASGRLESGDAIRRLLRAFFVAARSAFQEGDFDLATELCRQSRAYGRQPLRTQLLSLAATMRAMFGRSARTTAAS